MPAPILTDEEAKAAIGGLSGTLSEEDQGWLTEATEALVPCIEFYAGPIMLRSEVAELSGGWAQGTGLAIALPWKPNRVLSVVMNGQTVDPGSFFVDAPNGLIYYGSQLYPYPWPTGYLSVVVTALIGLEQVPPNVKMAAKELLRLWWQQGRQGGMPFGPSDQGEYRVPQGFLMPNRVIALIKAAKDRRMPGFA